MRVALGASGPRRIAAALAAVFWAVLLGVPHSAGAQSSDVAIRQLEQAWLLASRQNDTAAFSRLLAPEYRGTLVDGRTESREDRLLAFGSGTWRTLSLDFSDVQVRTGGDLAVATGLASRREVLAGQAREFQFYYTRVWQRRGGRWQAVSFQSTPVHPRQTIGRQRPSEAAESGPAPIIGAWRIVSRTYIAPDSIYTERQRDPGYYVFVAGHYAFVAPAGEAERPKDQRTEAHRLALYTTLGAQAGRYVLRGDTLTLSTLAAKNPGNVGMTIVWRAVVRGDTLTLESDGTYKRATPFRARYVLLRAGDAAMPVHRDTSRPAAGSIDADSLTARAVPPAPLEAQTDTTDVRAVDERDICRIVARYVEAYNRRDTQTMAALLAVDADYVGLDGVLIHGRDAVQKRQSQSHSSSQRQTRLTRTVQQVRFLSPDLALVDGTSEYLGVTSRSGERLAPIRGTFTNLMRKRDGTWWIIAQRFMLSGSPTESRAKQ